MVVDVVVLDWSLIAPTEDLAHCRLLVTRFVFDTEHLIGVWLQGLEELNVPTLLKSLILHGDEFLLR